MAPTKVLVWDACPFGLPILTVYNSHVGVPWRGPCFESFTNKTETTLNSDEICQPTSLRCTGDATPLADGQVSCLVQLGLICESHCGDFPICSHLKGKRQHSGI